MKLPSLSTLLFFLLTGSAALILTSCETEDSADVNQDRIYTIYELFYNSNTDKTIAIARFRFGGPTGTLLELNDPAGVTFNGEPLAYSFLYTGHAKEFAGPVQGGTFAYTNVDGETFENTMPSYDTIAFPATFDTLSKSQAFSLEWVGNALAPQERVGLFIGSWTFGEDALYVQDADGATDIVLGLQGLSNLPTGPSVFFMDRTREIDPVQSPPEGGTLRATFRAKNKTVTIVE